MKNNNNFDLNLWNAIYMPYVYSNFNMEEEDIISEVVNIYEVITSKEEVKQNCEFIKLKVK